MATDWTTPRDWTTAELVTETMMDTHVKGNFNALMNALARTCSGRLTLTSGTAVTTADVTAAATLYFAPHLGKHIWLYDGAAWAPHYFSETSLSLASISSGVNYDIFGYNSSGTFTLELLAWTNDSTRATALTTQDGILVKTGATTRRYLGTIRGSAAGQTEDSFAKRFVWNYYNRVRRGMRAVDGTNTWDYTTATYRQANAAAANQLACVIGVAEVLLRAEVRALAQNTDVDVFAIVAVGEDSTSSPASNQIHSPGETAVGGAAVPVTALLEKYPAAGYHYYAWLEYSEAVGTMTWIGDAGDATQFQSGIIGWVEG